MFRLILAALLFISTPALAVTQWDKSIPSSGNNLTAWPAAVTAQWSIMDTLLASYRQGERLTYNNTTTIVVTSGQVVVSNSGATLRIFLSDSGNTTLSTANLDSGSSFSAGTTYYVYAAGASSTAASSTYYISLSSSAPTGPTYYFQLGSFTTDGSGNITASGITNNNFVVSGQMSAAVSKSIDVAYQASTDGFFYGQIFCDDFKILTIYSDSNSSPSTTRQVAGCQSTTTSGYFSFSIPVKKNDYYKATSSGSSDFYTASAYFSPYGT